MFDCSYGRLVLRLWERYQQVSNFRHYATILAMTAAARTAKIIESGELFESVRARLEPFLNGGQETYGAYGKNVYKCGGNAAAWMLVRGYLPTEYAPVLEVAADDLCKNFPRMDGMFAMPGRNFVWIDTVSGVCPFLLWTGKALNRQDFIDESVNQMLLHHERLVDPETGLYHQAYNKSGDGKLSAAFWSRGVGWGLHALAEMVFDVPKDHPGYPRILAAWRQVLDGCLAMQDPDGMWHQAMEDPSTYPETSGTALICYAMGRGIKQKSIDVERFREPLERGMKGMLRYVSFRGSVFNTCTGALAPGETGSAAEYQALPHAMDDEHAFGSVMLALSQAAQLQKRGDFPSMEELLGAPADKLQI